MWQEPRFAGYIEAEYTELIPVDSNVFGVAALRLGDWWSGPGSGKDYMPHPPSSQQAAEQLNAKFKRDLKATGKLDSHTQVIHAMTEVLDVWTSPLPEIDKKGKAPVTLMGEMRAQPPLSPSHWMLHGDGMVRLPFTKTVVHKNAQQPEALRA